MKILVLLSGGLDSAVVLDRCKKHNVRAIGYDYGQPHLIELEYAQKIAAHYGCSFVIEKLPPMPRVNDVVFAGRNFVLVSHAIAKAQADGIEAVAVGCNESDWMRFPDCRPVFWRAVETAAEAYGVRVMTPLLYVHKHAIVEYARQNGVPIDLTWSCYDPRNGNPCGKCLACTTRDAAMVISEKAS